MTSNQKLSVLMSVYFKEQPEFLDLSLRSVVHQTRPADEIVIVEDGPLTDELYALLDSYEEEFPDLIRRVPLEKNMGLGLALRRGVQECTGSLIARMDTDDIAHPQRFEEQLAFFAKNPETDILGSAIAEFMDDPKDIVSIRKVPTTHNAICRYQRRRSAFNHMTVMYRRQAVLDAGNYEDAPLMEDDLLWLNMISSGCRTANTDRILVKARVGAGMFNRRGGWRYFLKYNRARKKALARKQISYSDYAVTFLVQGVIALIPTRLRSIIFLGLLR